MATPTVPPGIGSRGTTLIELLIGLVIIAVALAALATTLPLLTSLAATEDAEEFARDGRGCGEVLLAIFDADSLDLSGCPASGVDPANWADEDAPKTAEAAALLNAACGHATLELSCTAPAGADYDEVEIGWSRGGMSSLNLQFPRDED
ncbi:MULTISPECIES: prepilin-type N-terminal cleavage/methylation domain-containing protein [unclassified Thioalkalivibrio]|uniref:prepilin-type N-terminal cleavage/methylation domain-containing protein n=1 Tax=unclassified Thioalkalivibrio TaxID=2621013 RepID=UPI00037F4A51|nr:MULTISPECIES: prepilin-type N-terminal cleavage/methylation domain-containing protein [unclassified Thioalkalivibrio]